MRRTYPSDLLVVFVLTLVLLSLPTAIHFAFSDSFEPLDGPVDHYIVMPEMVIP